MLRYDWSSDVGSSGLAAAGGPRPAGTAAHEAQAALLDPGIYQMVFQTGKYFKANGTAGFYPSVTIGFETKDTNHYHVPLLLNPFGYSTYRGS